MNPMNQIMKMCSALIPEGTVPTNVVSDFLAAEFEKIFPDVEDIQLIRLLVLQISNSDPNAVLEKLVLVANDISEFVAVLNAEKQSEDGASDDR